MSEETCWLSATDLARRIRSKAISPVEVVKGLIDRIAAVNPAINAYVTLAADSALAEAGHAEDRVMRGDKIGPLHGVPFSVKDMTYTAGVLTTMGSELMRGFVPDEDAVHVARLRQSGAILLGKTNTPEFAAKGVTENAIFGVTRNPWDPERTTGGSSGGAAAAVAMGLGPLAVGNDAGGSIRIPASLCGVVGFKPQFGRIPSYPVFNLWETLNHEGPLTRTVEDAALMLDVMSGPHWGDRHSIPPAPAGLVGVLGGGVKGLKVAWSPDLGYAVVSAEVRGICEAAVRSLSEMGAGVEESTPVFDKPESTYVTIANCELAALLASFGPPEAIKGRITPFLRARASTAKNLTVTDYLNATFARRKLAADLGRFFEQYDLLLTPTAGIPAWPIGLPSTYVTEIDGKPVGPTGWLLTFPFNLSGQPAASVPAGWTAGGLPVGLQIVGRRHDEATVLRAARALEESQPWADRRPPLGVKPVR